ncbi:fatty-acid amide hydrolase 2-A [Caerostris extrusa]|uniref:Fatty-acid amide hydrolase 2-A n=1 Tax=Caerostris extrusa TaxID=172846 RepID=A0AAV4RFU6_CAEEX|nr:fatty-acid amide hydrolase 2-A [Caerostris extrusa]
MTWIEPIRTFRSQQFCIFDDQAENYLLLLLHSLKYEANLLVLFLFKGKIVPSVNNPLLLKSATQLAQEIRNGELKSEDVVQAYIDRIKEVEPYIHATAEKCFEDALEKAKGVDSLVSSGQYTKQQLADDKPFLGVPISIKALLLVKGVRSTAGYEPYSHLVAPEDAPAVGLMKNAGAIVITTTNVPEMGLNIDTMNRLYGATKNPYDTNRSSGGSSGMDRLLTMLQNI